MVRLISKLYLLSYAKSLKQSYYFLELSAMVRLRKPVYQVILLFFSSCLIFNMPFQLRELSYHTLESQSLMILVPFRQAERFLQNSVFHKTRPLRLRVDNQCLCISAWTIYGHQFRHVSNFREDHHSFE